MFICCVEHKYERDRGGLKELVVDIRDTNDHKHQSCMTCGSSCLPPLSYSAMRLYLYEQEDSTGSQHSTNIQCMYQSCMNTTFIASAVYADQSLVTQTN